MMMNAILFEKGKTSFQVLFIILFQWASTSCQLNLYNTDQAFKSNSLQFDCLNYHVSRETLAYQELSDVVDEVIPYCFRPENNFDESDEVAVHPLSQKLSFEQMRVANVTAQQLLSWSIPIEVAERYQFYLNAPDPSLNENFYNCTQSRFGHRCQYSFAADHEMSFDQIVEAAFRERIAYSESSDMMIPMPCYVLLECHRNGQVWCLDWREVCDGKIDCFDDGLDEEYCFDMEINECNEDECRCHNGLCISEELREDGLGGMDYLDRSDTAIEIVYISSCFQDPTFRCDECWIAMVCLSRLIKKGNENLCKIWLANNTAYTALEQCNSFFEFPTIPAHFDRIRFFYKDPHLRLKMSEFLLLDYVCYDQQLWDSIILDFVHENLTCLNKTGATLTWLTKWHAWLQLMLLIEIDFASCSIPHVTCHSKTKYSGYASLYKCQGLSKFISKHRIMDETSDCFKGDDERYPEEIPFQSFCDGIPTYFYDNNGQKHSDEFGCGNWSCDNIYTRCDGFWSCSDGRDEDNCSRAICPSQTYACLSPVNYTVICLPWELVNDAIVHCLGALDEQLTCRILYPSREIARPFRCSNDNRCLQVSQLCDKKVDCPEGDDEEFCKNQEFTCDQSSMHNRSDVEEVLCGLNEDENRRIKYFSVHTSSNYPSIEKNVVAEFTHWPAKWRPVRNDNVSRVKNNVWPWYCNRGLIVYAWIENNSTNRSRP